MGVIKDNDAYEEELLDYEEEDEKAPDSASTKAADSAKKLVILICTCFLKNNVLILSASFSVKKFDFKLFHFFFMCRGYVGIHSSGFRDFLLKPELLRSIVDSGFEHPSEGKVLNSCLMLTFVNSMN